MSPTVGDGYVLQPGEGRLIDLGGFSMSVKATGEETDGMFTLLEADEPPDFGLPLDIHHGIAEAFYVLEGEYIIFLDGDEFRCPTGSFIFIPAETMGSGWGTWPVGSSTRTSPLRWSGTSMT